MTVIKTYAESTAAEQVACVCAAAVLLSGTQPRGR